MSSAFWSLVKRGWTGKSGWDLSLAVETVLPPHRAGVAGAHPSERPGLDGSEMNGMRGLPFTSKLVLCPVAKGRTTSIRAFLKL